MKKYNKPPARAGGERASGDTAGERASGDTTREGISFDKKSLCTE